MSELLARLIAFLHWLFSLEELPDDFSKIRAARRENPPFPSWLFAGETLVSRPPSALQEPPPWRLLKWILDSEKLPSHPCRSDSTAHEFPDSSRSGSAADESRVAQVAERVEATPRKGFIHLVFSPEDCPECPTPATRRSAGFFAWLLSSETCPENESGESA